MKTYSVLETSKILDISTRAVQKRCLKYNIRKKGNKYLITENDIQEWQKKTPPNEPRTNQTNEPRTNGSQLDVEVESLKAENKELREELQQYDIADNEQIEVFTNNDYKLFESRLMEWRTQQGTITHQKEFLVDKDAQIKYLKESNDKILQMHQLLLDNIKEQMQLNNQRNTIEAKEKGVL